mgnify:CR=1 FL=1
MIKERQEFVAKTRREADELLEAAPPYLAWRALVLANPLDIAQYTAQFFTLAKSIKVNARPLTVAEWTRSPLSRFLISSASQRWKHCAPVLWH